MLLMCMFLVLSLWPFSKPTTPVPSDPYLDYPVYEGDDLGLTFLDSEIRFRLWAPTAGQARMHLYRKGYGGSKLKTLDLTAAGKGTWVITLPISNEGLYYTVQVAIEGKWLPETPDPYAVAAGVNGQRGQLLDVSGLNPPGWVSDTFVGTDPREVIIYELHVRDLSTHPSSGIQNKGKFLGLTEGGTRSPQGLATGLDHLVEMGITHVHLLPAFDFRSIDETRLEEGRFNWGYDPEHYNIPEGSYASDPYDGSVRILEFKQMVKALHDRGIGLVMDVVYNHTGDTEGSVFNRLVPGYYYRQWPDGRFSDASACGNETASERPMVRRFIVESILYWAGEYHIDGFRFDLMGIHDIETMNAVSRALHELNPRAFIYGEGWTAGKSPLPVERRALKKHTGQQVRIAAFSDDLRDGLKGNVFEIEERGFVSGLAGTEESVKFGIVAATDHPDLDYDKVNYSKAPWAPDPRQCMAYVSCHDNHTLWDKLALSRPDASEAERVRMHRLAGFIVLTSQGIPFLHAGVEMLRTKGGDENSFESPDSVNQIRWEWKAEQRETVTFFQQLIALRQAHPAFRMRTSEAIRTHLRFLPQEEPLLVGYQLEGKAVGDSWSKIVVYLNGAAEARRVDLPDQGEWQLAVQGERLDPNGLGRLQGTSLELPPISATLLFRK